MSGREGALSSKDWPETCEDCGETACSCVDDAQTMSAYDQALAIAAKLRPSRHHCLGKHGYNHHPQWVLDRLLAWIRCPGIQCQDGERYHPLPWTHSERVGITTSVCSKCGGLGFYDIIPSGHSAIVDREVLVQNIKVIPTGRRHCPSRQTNWLGVLVVMDWLTQNGAWNLVHEWRPTVELPPDRKDAVAFDPPPGWETGEFQRACERVQHGEGGTLADTAGWLARREWRWVGDDLVVEMHVANHSRWYPPPPPSYYGR